MSGKVPPSSRAGQGRASVSLKRPDAQRAALLYEKFTGHEAVDIGRIKVPPLPKFVAYVGELDGVLYTAVRDGKTERYIHEFAEGDKPMLCTSPDGQQLLIVGGAYDFTERGIVDASDVKTRRAMKMR